MGTTEPVCFMTKFQQLYLHCQTFSVPPKVPRNSVRDKALEITGAKVTVIKSGLDTTKCRGFFIDVDSAHPDFSQFGSVSKRTNCIVLARELNHCWERLVQTKELMHLFDDDAEKVGSAEGFESLLREFEVPLPQVNPSPSASMISEGRAVIMALACLCPETKRLEFMGLTQSGQMSHLDVAEVLRIPKEYVTTLLHPLFNTVINTSFV